MPILDTIFIISLYILPFLFVFLFIIIFLQILQKRGRLIRSLNMSLFLVTLPKDIKGDGSQKDTKELVAKAEQLYSILGNINAKGLRSQFFYGPLYIGLEIVFSGKEIEFYVAMPRRWESSVVKHIQGVYPEAEIQKSDDYNIFSPQGVESGSYAVLEKNYYLPIRTYKTLEFDSIGEITNVFSKMKEGDGGAIQIMFRKENPSWRKRGQEIAREMQKGSGYSGAQDFVERGNLRKAFGEFRDSTKTREEIEKKDASRSKGPLTPMQQKTVEALEEKSSKMGFRVNLRCVTSATTKERADEILGQIEDAFSQFSAPDLNNFKFIRGDVRKIIYDFSFRNYNNKTKMILNTEEMSSVFHFPLPTMETPGIKWLRSRSAPPPANLPSGGLVLGKNVFRGEEREIGIADSDRRRHLYTIGQTGTGKSVFIQEMIRQDIEAGKGVCAIDPHGDLIDNILRNIPQERANDVIVFDPSDIELPIGLNMLEYNESQPEQKTFIVNEMISIFQKLFGAIPESLGAMFEQYARNSLLLLLSNPKLGFTLMDVPRVLADSEFRRFLLDRETNLVVKEFWEKEAEKAGGEAALSNIAPYITSKFNIFIANDFIRPIIGQSKNGLNFREIMDNKKILLINLTKGRLGDINSSLLGLIMVGKILLASFSRVDMPEEERNDFYLYIDEFQNFTTDSIATILAEARKYRLNLTIAHQFISQLQEKIRDAVFGNVGSMVVFRIGVEDAEFISKQFKPIFSETDLLNIDNFNAYAKLLIDGQTSDPFNIQTYPPKRGNSEISSQIKEFSRKRYGRPVKEVEKEILQRARIAERDKMTNDQ